MKHYLRFGGLILGLALATGCGGKLESPPPPEMDQATEDAMLDEAIKNAEAGNVTGGGAAPADAGGGAEAAAEPTE